MADLGTKALSKAAISKHSVTLEYDNMDEERVEDAQHFGSGPEVRDGWWNSHLAELSR